MFWLEYIDWFIVGGGPAGGQLVVGVMFVFIIIGCSIGYDFVYVIGEKVTLGCIPIGLSEWAKIFGQYYLLLLSS